MKARTASIAETAQLLGIGKRTVRQMIADGRLAKVPDLGRCVRIPLSEVDRLVGSAVATPPPALPSSPVVVGAGEGIGAAGPGSTGKSSPARRRHSKDDDPAGKGEAVEERGALSTAARR